MKWKLLKAILTFLGYCLLCCARWFQLLSPRMKPLVWPLKWKLLKEVFSNSLVYKYKLVLGFESMDEIIITPVYYNIRVWFRLTELSNNFSCSIYRKTTSSIELHKIVSLENNWLNSLLQCNEFNWGHPTFFGQSQGEFRQKNRVAVAFGPITVGVKFFLWFWAGIDAKGYANVHFNAN